MSNYQARWNATRPTEVSAPGSRHVWYMAKCKTHGETSFNTACGGCEACARERLGETPRAKV